ncbi:hypothetical protein FGO68_gene9743 [Halteria grandinella]|uniref:TRP C-terminal domain-containing protein n=1 Tax=Halteria grandinella TaxID=5974 RepID=A0A8J8NFQ6_HALGN|nr:hypothetical protein FGO68_gene9743 [Halteria grandinella]
MIFGVCLFYPIWSAYLIKTGTEKERAIFLQNYGTLTQNLRLQSIRSESYHVIYTFKWTFTLSALVLLRDMPGIVLTVLYEIQIAFQAYLLYTKPFISKSDNLHAFLMEFLISLTIGWYIIASQSMDPHSESSYFASFGIIANVLICLVFNVSSCLILLIKQIVFIITRVASASNRSAKKKPENEDIIEEKLESPHEHQTEMDGPLKARRTHVNEELSPLEKLRHMRDRKSILSEFANSSISSSTQQPIIQRSQSDYVKREISFKGGDNIDTPYQLTTPDIVDVSHQAMVMQGLVKTRALKDYLDDRGQEEQIAKQMYWLQRQMNR